MAKMTILGLTVALLLATASVGADETETPAGRAAVEGLTIAYLGGALFDGEGFVERDFWVVEGRLRFDAPDDVDEKIDLKGRHVIPPFGDSHVHAFESAGRLEQEMEQHLGAGVFYARNPNNLRSGRDQVADALARADTIDVTFANGGLTASGAHPIPGYEAGALGIRGWQERQERAAEIASSRQREADAYFVVDDADGLEAVWPRVLEGRPDVVKVYLHRSEHHSARREAGDPAQGLDPALVPLIVARAHEAGLRTIAHIETAADFERALEAGVDEVAHMAGYAMGLSWSNVTEADGAIVADEVLERAARRGMVVTPTFFRSTAMLRYLPPDMHPDEATRERTRTFHRDTLRRLERAGVPIALGADLDGLTVLDELFYYRDLGAFDARTLLRLACHDTPRAIFPGRQIGRLQEGHEASFLVLAADPLQDLDVLRSIVFGVKQGARILPATPDR